jgi:hypothetical protein
MLGVVVQGVRWLGDGLRALGFRLSEELRVLLRGRMLLPEPKA